MDQAPHSGAGGFTANNDHPVEEYHKVVLETPECRAVAECPKRKTNFVFSLYKWTDIYQPKDKGEQKIHKSTKDRVKRKGTR